MAEKKLYRSATDKKLFGLCAGLAKYFNLDAKAVRIVTVILALIAGSIVFWAYLIAGLLLPVEPTDAE